MLAYTYKDRGSLALCEKPRPVIKDDTDAIVRVTLSSICTSDLHIRDGFVPRAVKGVTLGHEMVGVVEECGAAVGKVGPGDRVTVNCETFCGECWFCSRGYVNNCSSPDGGWSLGCRIDGGQAEYVRVPLADNCLDRIPDGVSDEQALFTGDLLSTGYWAAGIADIGEDSTVLLIGAGPTGICTLLCTMLRHPEKIIVCEKSPERRGFVRRHYPDVLVTEPEECLGFVMEHSRHGGADSVIELAGTEESFRLAWQCARPNATVAIVAMYGQAQSLPLPEMYGKNLTFKTGGVDGCKCKEILELIAGGRLDATPLISRRFPLSEIDKAYALFESRADGVMKIAVDCSAPKHNKQEYEPAHTAEHILNATMTRMFGCPRSRNAHIERKKSKCDYLLPACPDETQVRRIEESVNEVIRRGLEVGVEFVPRSVAASIVDLGKLPDDAPDTVRIVRIGDYDACACIGSHVSNTADIKGFRILSHSYADGVWRVRWKVASDRD